MARDKHTVYKARKLRSVCILCVHVAWNLNLPLPQGRTSPKPASQLPSPTPMAFLLPASLTRLQTQVKLKLIKPKSGIPSKNVPPPTVAASPSRQPAAATAPAAAAAPAAVAGGARSFTSAATLRPLQQQPYLSAVQQQVLSRRTQSQCALALLRLLCLLRAPAHWLSARRTRTRAAVRPWPYTTPRRTAQYMNSPYRGSTERFHLVSYSSSRWSACG